ncbi:MAG: DUF2513 domain-containing protein [Ruminococcus sp.]|nr:DUF2513 domain-containing protein [Ruminococcus sp.]
MKINYNCMRDILLQLDKEFADKSGTMPKKFTVGQLRRNPAYSDTAVLNALNFLGGEGYIKCSISRDEDGGYICGVSEITDKGYGLTDDIRSEDVWDYVRHMCEKLDWHGIAAINILVRQYRGEKKK